MKNIPDVTIGHREIPPGKVLLADPLLHRAELDREPRAEHIVLDTRRMMGGRYEVRLIAFMPGWACAGSMMRWDNGSYGYRWTDGSGAIQGRRFKTFDEAAEAFGKLPA